MSIINHPLDFERELVTLESQLEKLKVDIASGTTTKKDDYVKLENRVSKLKRDIYSKLTPYQRVQLSRHFDRPFTLDYVKYMIADFVELHGDRHFRDDPAIVGGLGWLGQYRVMIIGHQRGRTTSERLYRNFGMPQPEGYRKALRLMYLAEKFKLPIITLIDTQGAYPGIEAEERGQAEAIARNLLDLAELTVPTISCVIGEGGSGGALALGLTDRILMMENSCYSVITPEGCASILWHHDRGEAPQNQAALAAEILQLTAADLKRLGVIDEIVTEPLGGAHRNHKEAAEHLKIALERNLEELKRFSVLELVQARYVKYRAFGPVRVGDD
ncbi:MAG TPA: acetyl-CoA carboxylase carboxyltransferase subunit alpha [Oligoflexia bacterium]|nr:acetyl-CoA carboxylase carboxyltransferase subunit alpha [Oligoflexia bacterium]HMP26557.1 acetyl-CoA carboxylase carboxyltransferase subunit alpha [Oligoflexia bacterium]